MVPGAWQAISIGILVTLLIVIPPGVVKADENTPGVCQQAYGALDPTDPLPEWLHTEVAVAELHTENRFDLLAGHLLFSGFVDGSPCTGWGLNADGSPNGCGVALSEPAVVAWQNQFDEAIVDAARALQLPPRLVKAVIAVESQFWPGSDWEQGEVGLGQLTEAGADMLLTWRQGVYQDICLQVYAGETCQGDYAHLEPWMQAALHGKLLRTIDATCTTCQGGVDLVQARQSLSLLAEAIAASCQQTAYLVRRVSGDSPAQTFSYEDFVRLALANYHAGAGCLLNAMQNAGSGSSWATIAAGLPRGCLGGAEYIRRIEEQIVP